MAERIVLRRDTAANWATANPTLSEGELGYVTDTKKWKVGDGVTTWNSLEYNFDISDANYLVSGRGLNITGSYTPPYPTATDSITLWSKPRADRPTLMVSDDMLETYALQPAFFGRNIILVSPAVGATQTYVGSTPTAVGTRTTPTMVSGSINGTQRKTRFTSAATANSGCGQYEPQAVCWRGAVAGTIPLGGFFFYCRFALGTNLASSRLFVGVTSQITALAGEPSALPDCIGVGYDSTDAITSNLFLYQRTGTGTVVKTDLGVNASRAVDTVYDFYIYCAPSSGTMSVRLVNEVTDTKPLNNVVLTTLPASVTMLAPKMEMYTTTAASVILDVNRYYLETDY